MLNGGLRTKGIEKKNQQEKPLITVVTVVYNGAESLEQTITSVINQTYDNIEYIIIDGASSDSTLDIIKKYEDKIDYWQSEPDKGIYDAMNKGISLSSGEWINFMNSGDCFFDHDVIEKISKYSINNPIYDIIYGDVVKKDNTKIKQYSPTYINFLLERSLCHQSIFAKKRTFINNYFNISYKIIADRIWLNNSFKNKYQIGKIEETIAIYDFVEISVNYERFTKESLRYQFEEYGFFGVFIGKIKRLFH